MSDLNMRLRSLALATARPALLTQKLELAALRRFLAGDQSDGDVPALHEAGYLDEHGEVAAAGEWLRWVTTSPDAVSLSLRWQHGDGIRELQMWLDRDLVLLIDTRITRGKEEQDALLGYATFLDLPHVMASWLRLAPCEAAPIADREVSMAELRQLVQGLTPAGLGSLSAGDAPLLDFAHDGERYLLLLPPERPDEVRITLAGVTSWNLLVLLTQAATSRVDT